MDPMARRSGPLLGLGWISSCALCCVASADPVADFYKGRTLTIMVGQEPGTGYDIYARALARHFDRHIPGRPQIVVQNMPGASGINAANWLFGIAPRDGTVIGTFTPNVIVEPLLGNQAAKYGPASMDWIGNMEEGASICGMRTDAGVASFEDMRSREVLVGATGPTGPLGQAARVLNAVAGTRLKIIYGYKGSASVKLAVQKGEVHGVCGLTWSTIKSFWKDELDAGRFRPVIQLSARPQPDLIRAGTVHLDDIPRSEQARQIADLTFGTMVLGRVYAIAADVPPLRIDALRKAFMSTMTDPAFVADADKARIDIVPSSGPEVADRVRRYYAIAPSAIEKLKSVVSTP